MLSLFKQQVKTIEELNLESIAWKIGIHHECVEVYCDARETVMEALSELEDLQLNVASTGRWLSGSIIHENTLVKFVVYLQFN